MKKFKCIVCSHKDRKDINARLLRGQSNNSVAKLFGLSEPTVRRHRNKHLADVVVNAMAQTLENSKSLEDAVMANNNVLEVYGNNSAESLSMKNFKDMPSPLEDIGSHIKFLYEEAVETMLFAKAQLDQNLKLKALRDARECLVLIKNAAELLMHKAQDDELEVLVAKILDAVHDFPEAREAISLKLLGE